LCSLLEDLEHLDARQGRLQATVLQFFGTRHDRHSLGDGARRAWPDR
jgi:hypothetical protein